MESPQGTFSIVALDPENGDVGVAVQSRYFAVGAVVSWARAGVGAVATQAAGRAAYGPEILDLLARGLEPQAAIEAPRVVSWNFPNSFWPHSYHPGRVDAETRVPPEVRAELAAMGHRVQAERAWGYVSLMCAIVVDPRTGVRAGGADPRGDNYAAGW